MFPNSGLVKARQPRQYLLQFSHCAELLLHLGAYHELTEANIISAMRRWWASVAAGMVGFGGAQALT